MTFFKEKQEEADVRRQVRREKAYIPPEEPMAGPSKKAKTDTVDLEALKSKIRKSQQPKKAKK